MFFCKDCGSETPKWSGKCPVCGSWNSLKEIKSVIGKKTIPNNATVLNQKPIKLNEINIKNVQRITTGNSEFDGTLGGGLVPGMVVLIGGEPGIGKSTLILQISNSLAKNKHKVFYFSGEESEEQISIRANRLGCSADELYLVCTTNVETIIALIEQYEPDLAIIDSIQSVSTSYLDNAPGSVSQLRESTGIFTRTAKKLNIPIIMIGHVTKDGFVAGPKIIEHMVDTVLYFEGETRNQFKILRATKNRFGSTNEIGLFEMQAKGLVEIKNPSNLFLHEKEFSTGSAVGCILEGSRAFLVEVQALVSAANYGTSQRVALGLDHKKLAILLAVIEKKLSVKLRNNDVFVNLAGGIKAIEPSLDLAVVSAILSSLKEEKLPVKTLILGEVGLNGEVRPVSQTDKRLKEAVKLGYQTVILSSISKAKNDSIKIIRIKNIRDILEVLFYSYRCSQMN